MNSQQWGFVEVRMSDIFSMGEEARQYLDEFCRQRKLGRSGSLQWEAFLLHACKSKTDPPAVRLFAWLEECLGETAEVESLIADYQRVGGLLSQWDDLVTAHRYMPAELIERHRRLLEEMSQSAGSGGLPLGTFDGTEYRAAGATETCSLPAELRGRNPHILLLGRRHTGKTQLMAQMIVHDFRSAGRACIVVDPDGELSESVLTWIGAQPDREALLQRVVVIDPADGDNTPGYNPLEPCSDNDVLAAALALCGAFRAMPHESGGAPCVCSQQTQNILRNAAMLLMANGKTLIDLPCLLTETDYRDLLMDKLQSLRNERPDLCTLLDGWDQHRRLARTDQWINLIEPILNRLYTALGDPGVRAALTRPVSDIKLKEVITGKKLLLVRLSRNKLDKAGHLLGSLIITGLLQTQSMLSLSQPENRAVSLFVDGCDELIDAETMKAILDETSQLEIGLVASTRHVSALESSCCNTGQGHGLSRSWRRVMMTFGSVAVFAVDSQDAQLIAPDLFPLDAEAIRRGHRSALDQEKLNAEMLVRQEPGHCFWWLVDRPGGVVRLRSSVIA